MVSHLLLLSLTLAFDSTDKQGGFIGAMYLGGSNVAVELVREGLATVHSFSADGLPFGRELASAEEEAKNAKKNVRNLFTSKLMPALGRLHWRRSPGQGGRYCCSCARISRCLRLFCQGERSIRILCPDPQVRQYVSI